MDSIGTIKVDLEGISLTSDNRGMFHGIFCPFCRKLSGICAPQNEPNVLLNVECCNDECNALGPDAPTQQLAISKWMSVMPSTAKH